jgi:hypothetical protein
MCIKRHSFVVPSSILLSETTKLWRPELNLGKLDLVFKSSLCVRRFTAV